MQGLITKIQKFSVHDGPGIRTTVFFKGCPLSCVWCQNPETITSYAEVLLNFAYCIECKKCVEVCPKNCFSWAGSGRFKSEACNQCGLCIDNCPVGALQWSAVEKSSEDILAEIMQDKLFYDCSGGGITLSGGEPLQQPGFCLDLVSKAKALNINVAIDTSGYAPFDVFKQILPFVNLFLYDIKFINEELHKKYTGRSNALVLANFQELCRTGKEIIVRIPLITGLTDSHENLSQIRNFVENCGTKIKINYIPFNSLMAEKYLILGKENMFAKNLREG